MPAAIDVLHPDTPKRILIVASNPSVSPQTGWPVGFWWAELTHPYWEFVERGYEVTIASPEGGELVPDGFSDPEDESGYSAHDLISLGFKKSPSHAALLENTTKLADVSVVAAPYVRGASVLGTLAVVGPTRMDYARVIPLVEATAREISRALSAIADE